MLRSLAHAPPSSGCTAGWFAKATSADCNREGRKRLLTFAFAYSGSVSKQNERSPHRFLSVRSCSVATRTPMTIPCRLMVDLPLPAVGLEPSLSSDKADSSDGRRGRFDLVPLSRHSGSSSYNGGSGGRLQEICGLAPFWILNGRTWIDSLRAEAESDAPGRPQHVDPQHVTG